MKKIKPMLILMWVIMEMIELCNGKSKTCMSLYNEGGVQAVIRSNECSFEYINPKIKNTNHATNCHFASLKGRREYQEDHVFCDLDLHFNLVGKESLKMGIAAVFDGHGGKEASELAVQLLPLYFQLHVTLLSEKEMELSEGEQGLAFPLATEVNAFEMHFGRKINQPTTMEILNKAIVLTIHDIDSTFSQVALTKHLLAGTTGTIALIVGDQLLVANVGDSKAFLCSKESQLSNELNGLTTITSLQVKELTEDHHPDREDERSRITAVGGFVSFSGVPRVNGILAVSRAIGDVFLKRYGVIAEPEVTGWRHLNQSDEFLVVASDGIFESLSLHDVCAFLQDAQIPSENENDINRNQTQSKCLSTSLAECIVHVAFEKGSSDNLSAIVVPLRTH